MNATLQHREPRPDPPTHETIRRTLGLRVPADTDTAQPRRDIAARGMILRTEVGSTVHGTSIAGQDDVDEMGVCLEPERTVLGSQRFEHYGYRTALPEPGDPPGQAPRSKPGDLDLMVYSARKFCRLAAGGNATVLLPLWVPAGAIRYVHPLGEQLRAIRGAFVSQRVAAAFGGYLVSQRSGLLGERSGGTRNQGRADIRERYGYDVKFAAHMIRVGMQGIALLRDRHMPVPLEGDDLEYVRAVRTGLVSKADALERAGALLVALNLWRDRPPPSLPAEPDYALIDGWLVSAHRAYWGWTGGA